MSVKTTWGAGAVWEEARKIGSRALRYGLPSCTSVKTTIKMAAINGKTRYISTISRKIGDCGQSKFTYFCLNHALPLFTKFSHNLVDIKLSKVKKKNRVHWWLSPNSIITMYWTADCWLNINEPLPSVRCSFFHFLFVCYTKRCDVSTMACCVK